MIKFENPVVEVEKFDLVDVITTSECTDDCLLHCGEHDCGADLGFG